MSALKFTDDAMVLTMLDGTTRNVGQIGPRKITDADGDGVEDNEHLSHYELDRFYKPAVFQHLEDIYNTQHGELPGHHQKHNEHLAPEFQPLWAKDDGYGSEIAHQGMMNPALSEDAYYEPPTAWKDDAPC